MSRDGAFSRAQQTKNWCVGFSFPPPAYAGIHPTLYLFGFRANALNSHSPPSLPGFDPGPGPTRLPSGRSGVSGGQRVSGASVVVGLPRRLCRPPGASAGLRGPPKASGGPETVMGLVVGFASFLGCQPCSCLADPEISAFPGRLVNHRKGEGAPRRGSCPSTWRCSSRSKSLFRLA